MGTHLKQLSRQQLNVTNVPLLADAVEEELSAKGVLLGVVSHGCLMLRMDLKVTDGIIAFYQLEPACIVVEALCVPCLS